MPSEEMQMCRYHTFFVPRNSSLTHQADSAVPQMAVGRARQQKQNALSSSVFNNRESPSSALWRLDGSSGFHGRIEAKCLLCSEFRKVLEDGDMHGTKKLKLGMVLGTQHTAARLTTADRFVLLAELKPGGFVCHTQRIREPPCLLDSWPCRRYLSYGPPHWLTASANSPTFRTWGSVSRPSSSGMESYRIGTKCFGPG